jgi:glycosyltransferase involved in cell wall biosynthesis
MVEHSTDQFRDDPSQRRCFLRYFRVVHKISVVDSTIYKYLHETLKVPVGKLTYIPNGVAVRPNDKHVSAALRHTLGIAPHTFVLLFAGRLTQVKNVETLISAAKLIPINQRSNLIILIAGDGPERAAPERQTTVNGLSQTVKYLGARMDVPELMNASDALILTSLNEGQPRVILEAMAAGIPCIATSVGGIPELLADGRGYLAQPKDAQELARLITLLKETLEITPEKKLLTVNYIKTHHNMAKITDQYLHELLPDLH